MPIIGFDHYNVTCSDLERTRRFYGEVVGLREGERPPFAQPGAWMYLGNQAMVHISTMRQPTTRKSDAYDHVAFRAEGLEEFRGRLRAHGIYFEEYAVPDRNLHQLFFRDPDGAEVEIVFTGEEARAAAAGGAKVDASKGRNT